MADKADKAGKEGKAMGARLRRFREASGLSQTELGEKLGVSYQQVQKYERGVSRLSVDTLLRLARALDQPIAAFLPAGVWSSDTGQVAESRPEYLPPAKDERELLKAWRDLGDEKVRAAFLATLKAATSRKH
jgi:transcriptional regulator with XRE-family HTH domain